jgi:hypothetical protein
MKLEKGIRLSGLCGSVLLFLCIFVFPAEAVVIPLEESGWSVVISPTSQEVFMPVVEKFNREEVVIQLGKKFSQEPEDGMFQPIIIEFLKTSSDASSNIVIRDEYVVNDTLSEWFDFHMYLMVDAVKPQAGFNPNFVPDGAQLEQVYFSHNYGYNKMPVQLHFVDNNGKGVPSEPAGDDVFWSGLVSGQIVIATDPAMGVNDRFAVKQLPTIPEPTTVMLFGVGAFLSFLKYRRKDKAGVF